MDKQVADRFFKQTQQLPPHEQIIGVFSCSLDASV
jgi:hypothetical protein